MALSLSSIFVRDIVNCVHTEEWINSTIAKLNVMTVAQTNKSCDLHWETIINNIQLNNYICQANAERSNLFSHIFFCIIRYAYSANIRHMNTLSWHESQILLLKPNLPWRQREIIFIFFSFFCLIQMNTNTWYDYLNNWLTLFLVALLFMHNALVCRCSP